MVKIKQLYIGDVGCVVWDAAIVLTKFLENKCFFPDNTLVTATTHTGRDLICDREGTLCSHAYRLETIVGRSYWAGKRVIDLGSGTGVVGILAGVLG